MKGQKAQKGTLKKVLHYIRPYWALWGCLCCWRR